MDTRAQRDTRADGIRLVPPQQHFDFRHNDVVAASPVGEDTHLVIQFAIAIDADGDANLVLREEIDNLLGQ